MTAHFVHLLDDLKRRVLRMAGVVEDMLSEALDAVQETNESLARRVIRRDVEVDDDEVAVETEVIRLMALYQPVGSDLRFLCTVLKVNSDLERIADCAVNIAERASHLPPDATIPQREQLKKIGPVVERMHRTAVRMLDNPDTAEAAARSVLADEEVVDALYGEFIRSIVEKATETERLRSTASLLDVLSVAKNLERIADHAVNIAEDVVYLATGEIIRHQ